MSRRVDAHDTQRKHHNQRKSLPLGYLNIDEVPCRPQKDDKVAQGVLSRVEIIDGLDIETLRSADKFEDPPVSACGSLILESV